MSEELPVISTSEIELQTIYDTLYIPPDPDADAAKLAQEIYDSKVLRDTIRLEDQKALVFSSTGYGILGGFAGWGLMSIGSSFIVILRWCKAKERSFSDKFNIFFFMLMAIGLVSIL